MSFFTAENQKQYSQPGVFCVSCVISENTFFGESENMYNSLWEIYWELYSGVFEDKELQKDFRCFGETCFDFEPIAYGPEYSEKQKRQDFLKSLSKFR